MSQDPELLRRLLRAKERLALVSAVSEAQRPDLTIAVSEKRRQEAGSMNESEELEVP